MSAKTIELLIRIKNSLKESEGERGLFDEQLDKSDAHERPDLPPRSDISFISRGDLAQVLLSKTLTVAGQRRDFTELRSR